MNHHHHHSFHRAFSHPRGGRFGHMMRDHTGRSHHRHGGPSRMFDQGELRWVMLSLIAEKNSHGYELIKAIEERLGGVYSPSPGVIYPTLNLLEELGHIAVVESDGAKKAFAITEEGRAARAQNEDAVRAIFARMADVAERVGGGPSPQIIRAMENLKLAMRLKLEAGRLNEAQVAAITNALDEAAVAIERS